MIALLLCGLFAGACAAPQFQFSYGAPQRPLFSNYHMRNDPFGEDLFDTRRFWSDLSKEMKDLDDMLADFSRRFPTSVSQEGTEGTEYKISIPLSSYDEKDIVVKARNGLLMVQANHKNAGGGTNSYLDVRTLPDSVNVTGTWVFQNGVLKITFPLKDVKPKTEVIPTTEEQVDTTSRPNFTGSREEIETNVKTVQDADVGIAGEDLNKEHEVKTNEIPNTNTVEATTYAVDLKDEVEFIPIRY